MVKTMNTSIVNVFKKTPRPFFQFMIVGTDVFDRE